LSKESFLKIVLNLYLNLYGEEDFENLINTMNNDKERFEQEVIDFILNNKKYIFEKLEYEFRIFKR